MTTPFLIDPVITTASRNANTLQSFIAPTPPPSKCEPLPTCFDFRIRERAFCPQIYLYRSHFLLYGPEFQRDIQLSASIATGLSQCRSVLAWSGGECPASQVHSFNLMGVRKGLWPHLPSGKVSDSGPDCFSFETQFH
ncbi:hypothetical protein AVEN_232591-1 [Araneus ventricosus]|uniref:Uncharacterized protein n=1 Tax=Araneus ventricosus TaxID=182803 RepID=A0A4Y2M9Q8_ARAVE|nr:hypothetical protein AVEN_232591-1 [Araneus ventricosus]